MLRVHFSPKMEILWPSEFFGSVKLPKGLQKILFYSCSILAAPAASAQDRPADTKRPSAYASGDFSEIIVTATRRAEPISEVPFQIAVLTNDDITRRGVDNLREAARLVPGVYLVDSGARNMSVIVFRGINANRLGSNDSGDNGGTVGIYFGDVPLMTDLRLRDLERVEFLVGPQSTEYGSGTLSGAIRYIPKQVDLDRTGVEGRGNLYGYTSGSGVSSDLGATINVPVVAGKVGFRASIDRLNDQGFIDYPLVVSGVGTANPDDFANPANFDGHRDVNDERTLTFRASARARPVDWLDLKLTYMRQKQKTQGRQMSGEGVATLPMRLGRYDSAQRVLEPNERKTELYSIEGILDIDFAKLTSTSAWTTRDEHGARDQTDLLLSLNYGYELFPELTTIARERDKYDIFTHETRLVSASGGRFEWLAGLFYLNRRYAGSSREFAPGYDVFAVNNLGGIQLRPDSLEFFGIANRKLTELGLYGELSYAIADGWRVGGGVRYYDYKLKTRQAVDLPLLRTVFFGDPADSIVHDYVTGGQSYNGALYKFSLSYQPDDRLNFYATYSEGMRAGNSNNVPPCTNENGSVQAVCAQPGELQYLPDRTRNFELGFKTRLLDGRLMLNGSAYHIKWIDPQVASATLVGLMPITINGKGAASDGVDISLVWQLTPRVELRGIYSYTHARLTTAAPNLISYFNTDSSDGNAFGPTLYADGVKGDRMPGSPRHKTGIEMLYRFPLSAGISAQASYAVTAQSGVLATTGNRGNGFRIPGYAIQDAALSLSGERWWLQLYCDNIFNVFGVSGIRDGADYNQTLSDINGNPVYARSFGKYVLPPRVIGLRIGFDFGGIHSAVPAAD